MSVRLVHFILVLVARTRHPRSSFPQSGMGAVDRQASNHLQYKQHPRLIMPQKRKLKLPRSLTSSRQRTVLLTLILLCLLLASVGAIIAHTITSQLPQTTVYPYQKIDLLRQQQRLIVGIDPNHQPLRYLEDSQIVGYEADLARAIGYDIGLTVDLQIISQEKIVAPTALTAQNPLNTNHIHLYISGAFTNRLRQQFFGLSSPYLNQGQVAIGQAQQADITSLDQLKHHIITAITTEAGYPLAQQQVADSALIGVSTVTEISQRLLHNQADVGLIDLPTARLMVAQQPKLRILSPVLSQDSLVILVSRQNQDLVELVNHSLTSLNKRGVLVSLQKKWLESHD